MSRSSPPPRRGRRAAPVHSRGRTARCRGSCSHATRRDWPSSTPSGGCAGQSHPLGNLPTQLLVSRRQNALTGVQRMIAQHFAHQIVEPLRGIHGRRSGRAVQRDEIGALQGLAAHVEHLVGDRRGPVRARGFRPGLGQALELGCADVETGLRPRFDQADVLQVHVSLHHRRDADACRAAHRAHRRDALVRTQRPARDLRFDEPRDALVEKRGLR